MARRWIKLGIWSAVSVLALTFLYQCARFIQSTSAPGAWKQLTPDLKRDDLLAIPLGRHFGDMLELKGYDLFFDRADWIGGSWRMQVTYETNGQVKTAEASYIHPKNGWLHRNVLLIP